MRNALRLLWLAMPLLLLMVGCQANEEITTYQVLRSDVRAGTSEPAEDMRLLGAIIPMGDQSWFFKLIAPASAVAKHDEEFKKLLRSLKPGDRADAPLTWTVPEGWKQTAGGGQFRYATLRFGPADKPLEMTVSHSGGGLVENVDRWRGQLGLEPLKSEAALREQKLISDLPVGDFKVVLVDMTGPGAVKGKGPGPMFARAPGKDAAERPSARIQYAAPPGWKPVRPKSSITHAAFRLPDSSGDSPEVTVTPLPGRSGTLLDNINRWRAQLGLKPVDEEPKDQKKISVAGQDCSYIEISGPEGPGAQRLLAVACKNGATTWFFKLQAPTNLAAKNQAAFEAFVKSVHFDAGPGANP